ncbi:MAG: AMP-binding protein, partial [Thermodesulfobacteriota bacterium]
MGLPVSSMPRPALGTSALSNRRKIVETDTENPGNNMLSNLALVTTDAARRFGDKTALIFEGRRMSFGETDRLACRLANALAGIGIKPGDRVTLYAQNCWEWIVAYYGILKTGAVVNPVNVMLTPAEIGYVTRDCGARAILASADKGEALLDIRKDTPLETIMLFGGAGPAGAVAFDTT